ncbi:MULTISPECIES: ABC transporter permease subunit [unclassified Ensifer]|uniref:ABC transporter permease n=1 Tax=unclassified Ensifer TaxID=2633371 RepID=UPI000812ECB5|nr:MULTISPECIES: ABC transporter permease subunit [unclassified Ensifer]OCP15432.1 polar amino acid ABC transporter permease [Ensifer sp. LC384]OCP16191.1 polar amino acid ABC transporter permease [Ensifer sp. LC163]OCP21655.1 polar amino acid ABC transporter permease [Ensifer sp. LC54]
MDYYWQLLAWGGEGWGDDFAWGLVMTLQVSVVAYAVAVVFGLLGAAGKLSKHRLPRLLADIYTTVVRSLPELLVILLLYFSVASGAERLLKHLGLVAETFQFSSFWAAIIALAFVSGAFMTEVLRSAFLAVPPGQIEAAVSIGMRPRKVLSRIVLPQMMRHAVPGMGNLWLSITKESAIISVLGSFSELLYTGYRAAAGTKQYIFFYGLTAVLFLLITLVSALVIAQIERRLNRGHH